MIDHEQLLDDMLNAVEHRDRVAAFDELGVAGWGGMTVLDFACGHDGKPIGIPLSHLLDHLRRSDNAEKIRTRGRRLHTSETVEWGSAEDAGSGPALAFGAGRSR